jgi:leucyl aminopeptidase
VNVTVSAAALSAVTADAVIVGVHTDDKKLRDTAARVDAAAGGAVAAVLKAESFSAKPGQVTHVHTNGRLPSRRVVVVGLGRRSDVTA